MTTPRWRALAFAVLGPALCVLLAGCSYSYPFEVSGFVRSAATGEPLSGVKVFSTHLSAKRSLAELVPGEDTPVAVTGEDGSFSFAESVRDVHLMTEGGTKWVLLFSKEGFTQEDVDLQSVRRPSSTKTTVPVFVVVYLTEQKPPR